MYTIEDFPIGSKFRIYRIVDIQVDPYKRKKGEKRNVKEYAYYDAIVTHHVGRRLVGSDNERDCGYDVTNDGIISERHGSYFIVPLRAYKNTRPSSGNRFMNHIIAITVHRLKEDFHSRIFHPNAEKIRAKLYAQRQRYFNNGIQYSFDYLFT